MAQHLTPRRGLDEVVERHYAAFVNRAWREIENPRLKQIAPLEVVPDRPSRVPEGARVLRALDEPLDDFVTLDAALAVETRLAAIRATVHVPAGYGADHDRVDPEIFPLKPREGHTTPVSRSMWKRRPGTYRMWAET